MPRRLVALLIAAALLGAACGDSGSDDSDDGGGGAGGVEVTAIDFEFKPATVEVEAGAEIDVTFTNAGTATHSFTAEDAGIDLEAEAGEEAEGSFTAPDEDASIEFVCRFHEQMMGTIVVGAGGDAGAGDGSKDDGETGDTDDYDY